MSRTDIAIRQTARGLAARTRIVETAARMIHERGVANTSLDVVLAASGTSKSQVYHYFRDKDDLVLAVIRHQTEFVLARQETLLCGLTSLADLRCWRDAVVEMAASKEGKGGCPLGTLLSELAASPEHRLLLAESFARWEGYFERGLTEMLERGELRPCSEPKTLAVAMMAALQGGLLLSQATCSTTPLEIALDMAIAHLAS